MERAPWFVAVHEEGESWPSLQVWCDAAATPENQGFARLWRKKRQGK